MLVEVGKIEKIIIHERFVCWKLSLKKDGVLTDVPWVSQFAHAPDYDESIEEARQRIDRIAIGLGLYPWWIDSKTAKLLTIPEDPVFKVTFKGFESKEQAVVFAQWYSGQGEQDAAYWLEEHSDIEFANAKHIDSSDPEEVVVTIEVS